MKPQAILAIVGLLLVGLGIFAYPLGLSATAGISAGKIVFVSLGLLSAVIALLGRRTISVYKATAVIFLNTLVLFGLLEIGLLLLGRLRDFLPDRPKTGASRDLRYVDDGRERLLYYKMRDWSDEYWREYHFVEDHLIEYRPYTVWGTAAFRGKTITIDEEGLRETPGASCVEDSWVVFAFGGSTTWGTGVPDWGTIPAHLQQELGSSYARPVCVVNYGEQGYVSTQSVIRFLLALQCGKVPDLVIFYSGTNDVFAAYQSSRAGVHQNLRQVAARYESRDEISPIVRLLSATRTFSLVRRFADGHLPDGLPFVSPNNHVGDVDELAASVAQIYLGNYQIVEALAEIFNFDFHFFWQSNLLIDSKPLTPEEASIKEVATGVYPGLTELLGSTREKIERAARERPNLHNIDRLFEQETSLIYVDPWHVTVEGNRMVARAMLGALSTIGS